MQIEYARAVEHFREAEKLTDRERSAAEWAEVQHAIADLLYDQGQYSDAEKVLRGLIEIRSRVLGPEHPDTLWSRNNLAKALGGQGKYAEAEAEFRAVLKLLDKVLGPEHPDTLQSCYDFAFGLRRQNRLEEANEFAQRAAGSARKVLGPDHPDTKK